MKAIKVVVFVVLCHLLTLDVNAQKEYKTFNIAYFSQGGVRPGISLGYEKIIFENSENPWQFEPRLAFFQRRKFYSSMLAGINFGRLLMSGLKWNLHTSLGINYISKSEILSHTVNLEGKTVSKSRVNKSYLFPALNIRLSRLLKNSNQIFMGSSLGKFYGINNSNSGQIFFSLGYQVNLFNKNKAQND